MPFMVGLTAEPYETVTESITSVLTQASLTSILTYAIGLSIGFVLFYFAVRKVWGILRRAFTRGKLRL